MALAGMTGDSALDLRDAWTAEAHAAHDDDGQAYVSPDVQLYFIEVSLHDVGNASERNRLLRLPTSLTLPSEEIERIRQAARTLLLQSTEYRRLLADLGATAPAAALRRRAACTERDER